MSTTTVVSEGLARKVRVWNDGPDKFDYKVNGERVVIPSGQYKEMARRTGIELRGFYPGRGIPVKLRLEMLPERDIENIETVGPERVYACPKCDESFDSKDKYQKHYDAKHKRVRGKPAARTTNGDAQNGEGDE